MKLILIISAVALAATLSSAIPVEEPNDNASKLDEMLLTADLNDNNIRNEPVLEEEPATEPEPIVEPQQTVEQEPIAEPQPVVDEQEPIVEHEPIVEPEPIVEQEPIIEQIPIVEQEPINEQVPIIEQEPINEQVPIVEEIIIVEEDPINEQEPIIDSQFFVQEDDFIVEEDPIIDYESENQRIIFPDEEQDIIDYDLISEPEDTVDDLLMVNLAEVNEDDPQTMPMEDIDYDFIAEPEPKNVDAIPMIDLISEQRAMDAPDDVLDDLLNNNSETILVEDNVNDEMIAKPLVVIEEINEDMPVDDTSLNYKDKIDNIDMNNLIQSMVQTVEDSMIPVPLNDEIEPQLIKYDEPNSGIAAVEEGTGNLMIKQNKFKLPPQPSMLLSVLSGNEPVHLGDMSHNLDDEPYNSDIYSIITSLAFTAPNRIYATMGNQGVFDPMFPMENFVQNEMNSGPNNFDNMQPLFNNEDFYHDDFMHPMDVIKVDMDDEMPVPFDNTDEPSYLPIENMVNVSDMENEVDMPVKDNSFQNTFMQDEIVPDTSMIDEYHPDMDNEEFTDINNPSDYPPQIQFNTKNRNRFPSAIPYSNSWYSPMPNFYRYPLNTNYNNAPPMNRQNYYNNFNGRNYDYYNRNYDNDNRDVFYDDYDSPDEYYSRLNRFNVPNYFGRPYHYPLFYRRFFNPFY